VFRRIRDPIGDSSAIWVAQVTMTERDEQPLPAGYNLHPADSVAWRTAPIGCVGVRWSSGYGCPGRRGAGLGVRAPVIWSWGPGLRQHAWSCAPFQARDAGSWLAIRAGTQRNGADAPHPPRAW